MKNMILRRMRGWSISMHAKRNLAILLCTIAAMMILMYVSYQYYNSTVDTIKYDVRDYYEIENVSVKKAGLSYDGRKAVDGFAFYEVTTSIANISQDTGQLGGIYLRCKDGDDHRFYSLDQYDEELIDSGGVDLAPAGRTVELTQVVEISKDCEELIVYFEEEQGIGTATAKLPQ